MPFSDLRATSGLFWSSALAVAFLDTGLVLFLAWRIKPERFRQLGWELPVATALFWGSLWTCMLWWGWNWFYSYIFPGWARWVAPAFGLVYAAIGWVLFELARRAPSNPLLNFCLLGGLEGFITHMWAVYGLGVIDHVPMLAGVSPASVIVFSVFEKILYWSIVLGTAVLFQNGLQRWRQLRGNQVDAV